MIIKARLALRKALFKFEPGDCVIVAVSGGADSLLLAHCLQVEAVAQALKVYAVIIDHQLQENSREISHSVKKKLLAIGIPEVEVIAVLVEKQDGLEADARRARYEALNKFSEELGGAPIFLGHNENDLAESVLLGLTQGSGTKSLAGMRFNDGKYFRPFLSLSREEILLACAEGGLEFWDDPHNQNEQFTRVKIRKNILPILESEIGPGVTSALARSAHIFREDSDALDLLADEIYATLPDQELIAVAALEHLPVALRKRVLRRALAQAGATRLSAEQVGWIEALISEWAGQGEVNLPAGVTVRRESGRLALSKKSQVQESSPT